jgi:hypothetical protein
MSLLEDCVEFLAIIAIASTVKSPFSMLVINHGETCQAKAALLVILDRPLQRMDVTWILTANTD